MISRARSALTGMATAVLLASPTIAHADPASRASLTTQVTAQDTSAQITAHTTGPANKSEIISDSPTARVWRQTGMASWYGGARWHGKMTASGVRYDQNKLTAAHATLPIGTKVRVQLEGSDRSVVVVINDRPGTRRRIIDLSRQAAAELGILNQGVAVVTLAAL